MGEEMLNKDWAPLIGIDPSTLGRILKDQGDKYISVVMQVFEWIEKTYGFTDAIYFLFGREVTERTAPPSESPRKNKAITSGVKTGSPLS